MASPFFTVIVPTFNRAAVLVQAVASVLSQKLTDFELLIVDDGSTDDTPAVVAALDDARIHSLRQENRGVSAARNLGLSHARGEAVTFLDSDDEACADWLSAFADLLHDPRTGIVAGGALVIHRTEDGKEKDREVLLPRALGPLYGHQELSYLAGTLAARRDLLESIEGYAEPMSFAENAEMAMRLVPACLARGLQVAAVDRPLVIHYRAASAWVGGRSAFERMRAGAEYILEHHGERMRSAYPYGYANYRGVAGVNAARLGDFRSARRHLAQAVRAQPRNLKNHLRWALTWLPPLARRLWTRHG